MQAFGIYFYGGDGAGVPAVACCPGINAILKTMTALLAKTYSLATTNARLHTPADRL